MREVFEQAQKLGEAIVASDIYRAMQSAEDAAQKDAAAVQAFSEYLEMRSALESMLTADNVDRDAVAEQGKAMKAKEQAMNEIPAIRAMQEARSSFTQLMDDVNQILQMTVNGQTDTPEQQGCTGSCSTCGGCCH